jgi:hypothetical protein
MKTQYLIVEAKTATILESRIDALLAQGWECQGGVSFNQEMYTQAMVK